MIIILFYLATKYYLGTSLNNIRLYFSSLLKYDFVELKYLRISINNSTIINDGYPSHLYMLMEYRHI